MSLRDKIKQRFIELHREDPLRWTGGEEVERFAERLNFKPSNASRRLREMANEGLLEVKYRKSSRGPRAVCYRLRTEALPPPPPQYERRGDVMMLVG
jgi:predicted transcriptional regulator